MNLRTILLVFLCFCATTVLRAERVDMLKAGAKANGKALNTKLINSTIDRLNRGGGGTLFFPAGTYLTGYFPPRSTTEECYKQIISDLEYAEQNAPGISGTDRTIMSKTVAQALLCKVYAEKAVQDYDKVIAYAEKVSDTPGVVLEEDFSTLWGWDNTKKDCVKRNTSEGILEVQWLPGGGNWESWMYGRSLENYDNSFTWAKWVTPSRDLIKAYEDEGDTTRLNQTVVYYSCTWSNYYPASHYAFMYKLRSGYNNEYIVRLGDILLLEARGLCFQRRCAKQCPTGEYDSQTCQAE